MRVLIAPDKFKGSLTALAAAQAIERGLRAAWPHAEIDLAPIADGGEGFAEAMAAALGAEWIATASEDALGRPITAHYAWLEAEKLAVFEMSEASGLWRLPPAERNPLTATTRGTGLLLADAIQRGARRVVIGLGGSATTDGGAGLAHALGYRFLRADGEAFVPLPASLDALAAIERPASLPLPEIVAACDVQNPLLGERGTARVYAPQKGADPQTVELLESRLAHLADVCAASLGQDFRDTPGAGAAGGLGFGLLTFAHAKIQPGFDLVAAALRLEARVAAADLVITGEGCIDAQTLEGKGPARVAALARTHHRPIVAFCGIAEVTAGFDAVIPMSNPATPRASAMQNAASLLERAATNWAVAL